jgi:hypothetical protein
MAWLWAGAELLTSFQGSVVFECDPSLFTGGQTLATAVNAFHQDAAA